MSRHRNVRNMDYRDYDGFDDYGQSFEDEEEKVDTRKTVVLSDYLPIKVVSAPKTATKVIKGFEIPSQKPFESSSRSQSPSPNVQNVKKAQKDECNSQVVGALKNIEASGIKPIQLVKPSSQDVCTPEAGECSSKELNLGIEETKLDRPNLQSVDASEDVKTSKMKSVKMDVQQVYNKERGDGKEHLYMVVIGHVDAGKSTMMGRLLCELNQVEQKIMHKYKHESKKIGKQSFMYAWVLDETGEERTRGITMDIGQYQFETKTRTVTILDAPGHKDFIPNMISGAGQADVALMVVDASSGEFETGFDLGGQTREHALLVRSLGVTQMIVAVNKLDTVSWAQERFDEIVERLKAFLKQAGFKSKDVTFVPCSGLTGENLVKKPVEPELLKWYKGLCLLEAIDNFCSPERPIDKPFRLSINDVFKGVSSGFCISGKIEAGALSVGDKVLMCPGREAAVVRSLAIDDDRQNVVFAGDQATVVLSGVDMQNVYVGNVLCDPLRPVQVATKFQARIVVFNVKVPITKGFSVVLHHHSLVEPVVVSKLVSQLDKSTGEIVKKHPRFLGNNTSAVVEITVGRSIALELYSECKELGRVLLRVGGVTIAAGLIIKVIV